jgi:DNA-binding response OmpR family regulator
MKKILVVDDEPSIRDLLELILVKENFNVITSYDGKDAILKFKQHDPDLVVLDVGLPDMSGFDVLRSINGIKKTPVIMLTVRNDIVDKVLGLELGADDYITKPFDGREFVARVKAVLRRLSDYKEDIQKNIKYLDIEINTDRKLVVKNGSTVTLTPKEYTLLEVMITNPKKVFSREELLAKAWGYDYLGDSRAVDICITRLRKKLEDDPSKPKILKTVYGFGYCFGGGDD